MLLIITMPHKLRVNEHHPTQVPTALLKIIKSTDATKWSQKKWIAFLQFSCNQIVQHKLEKPTKSIVQSEEALPKKSMYKCTYNYTVPSSTFLCFREGYFKMCKSISNWPAHTTVDVESLNSVKLSLVLQICKYSQDIVTYKRVTKCSC
jgi:hypothetical protein